MRKESWKYYISWAVACHQLAGGFLAWAGWLAGEQEEKPAMEVGFVAEAAVSAMAGGSGAGAAAGGGGHSTNATHGDNPLQEIFAF